MIEKLLEWASRRGYRVAWGPGSTIAGVTQEIAGRRSGSEINESFFENELKSMVAAEMDSSEHAIILVAKPVSAHLVGFDVGGRIVEALLPPTYFRYRTAFEEVRRDLAENVLKDSHVEHLAAPLKALASRLGLVDYGRNNIGYVKGMGSYFQLCGYVTDARLSEMSEPGLGRGSLLADCENCGICMSMCPTGAITDDRVLLRAERCLTYANENAGDWPDWVSPDSHNSLVGCLECQRNCPANPELPVERSGLSFSAAETRRLLSSEQSADTQTETGIRFKLAWLGQPYIESVLGRNLKALLKSKTI
jgi:epoxyqueuosine reductase